jgi:hypothetical protein
MDRTKIDAETDPTVAAAPLSGAGCIEVLP